MWRFCLLLVLCSAGVCSVEATLVKPQAGEASFEWVEEFSHFNIWANEVPISSLVHDLGGLYGADIEIRIDPGERKTFRFFNVSLEDCLERLNLNYTLTYARQRSGALALTGGRAGRERNTLRFQLPPLPVGPEAERVRKLVEDLKDDDIRWNYENAMSELFNTDLAPLAIPFLEPALLYGDRQQQEGAYYLLRSYLWRSEEYVEPSPMFLRITLEGLRDDGDQDSASQKTMSTRADAANGFRLLAEHPELIDRLQPQLEQALYDADAQYRFLSATLLASQGKSAHAARLVDILAPQLMDNETWCDSRFSVYGLTGLGPSIEPYLNAFEQRADEQARKLIQTIRSNWVHPEEIDLWGLCPCDWTQDSFADL